MAENVELPAPIDAAIAAMLAGDGIAVAGTFADDGFTVVALDKPLRVLLGWRPIVNAKGSLAIAGCAASFAAYIQPTSLVPSLVSRAGTSWHTLIECRGLMRKTALSISAKCDITWQLARDANKVQHATLTFKTGRLVITNRHSALYLGPTNSVRH